MNIVEIKSKLESKEYSFLRENEHLKNNIVLLGLGGSHAYGTNKEGSDLDIRGIALNSKREILTNASFEQFTNDETDTVVYSFNKIINLLSNCNPNTIELLGLKPEHYLVLSPIGEEILSKKEMFLSKRAINSFGGYANSQLYRMNQKSANQLSQKELEEHILKTLQFMQTSFVGKYTDFPTDGIKLYIDKAVQEDFDTEIFMDVKLTHYPLRDYKSMWSELHNTVKAYAKIGRRNENAIEHGKLGKHMMHLVRLYYMCFDILEKKEINTYREKEHDLLMSIRNGSFLDKEGLPISDFYDMVADLERRLQYDAENTDLPDNPNYEEINEFVASVNERIVKGDIPLVKDNRITCSYSDYDEDYEI